MFPQEFSTRPSYRRQRLAQARLDEVAAAAEAAAAGSEGLDAFRAEMDARLAELSSQVAGERTALREYVDEQLQGIRSEAAASTSIAAPDASGADGSEAAVAAVEQRMEAQLGAVRGQLGDIRLEASEAAEAAGGLQDYVDSAMDDLKVWVSEQLATGKALHPVENGDSVTDGEPAAKAAAKLQALVAPLDERLTALQSAVESQKAASKAAAGEAPSEVSGAADAATGLRADVERVAANVAALREDVSEQVHGLRNELLSMAASVAPTQHADADASSAAEATAAEQASVRKRLEELHERLEELHRSQTVLEAAINRADAAEAEIAGGATATDAQLAALREELTNYVDSVAAGICEEVAAPPPAKEAEAEEDSGPPAELRVATGASRGAEVLRHQAKELAQYADSWVAALADALSSFAEDAGPSAAAVAALYNQLDEALLGLAGELAAAQGGAADGLAEQAEVCLRTRAASAHHPHMSHSVLLSITEAEWVKEAC